MTPRWLTVVPLSAVALALVWLAVDAGTPWPWGTVVHEDGRRTLFDTVVYPRHFLRELPVLAVYLFALGMAAPREVRGRRTARSGPMALAGAGAMVVSSLLAVSVSDGWETAWRDAAQYYVRDDEGWRGAHWGGHVLGAAGFVLTAWLVRPRAARTSWRAVTGVAAGCVLTALLVADPLVSVLSPHAAGHQLREWLTHAAVTLPLGLAAMGVAPGWPWRRPNRGAAWAVLLLLLLLAVLLAGLTVGGGALADRPAPLSAHLGAHVVEHAMDYAFVGLVCWALRRPRDREATGLSGRGMR